MAKLDPTVRDHLEWLGYVQPTGLVVSPFALGQAGVVVERSDAEGQRLLRAAVVERALDDDGEPEPIIEDFIGFARSVLGWSLSAKHYAGTTEAPIPPALAVELPDGTHLAPDLAVGGGPDGAWQLLVRVSDPGTDPDEVRQTGDGLELSEHQRLERLLRGTQVTAGLLCTGRSLRLVSAPAGETSGWLDFRVADLHQTAGRVICSALRKLLGQQRLLTGSPEQRLGALLLRSRRYQNQVSDQLAQQVLHALYELLRGFQAADDASGGELLALPLSEDRDEVYRGLLTVTLRLVFLLYAEERGMLPDSEAFARGYSLAALYERLREDAAQHPDTMGARYGAWAQLLVLFRVVHDGARFPALSMPARRGVLFDPNRFGFLEGRRTDSPQSGERIVPPRVPDATVFRVLDKLLVLEGERLSYRALDVEQIGSVYQTMMGFRLHRTSGRSVAVKARSRHGAPTAVNLDALLTVSPASRVKRVKEQADRELTARQAAAVKAATTVEELHAALSPVVDREASPDLIAPDAMVLQPSDERRKSGSHYTPRELTEPIVRTTLEPLLAQMRTPGGRPPTPAAILDLKVCDPALGSGAFLVEACRQLADALVDAWAVHGGRPALPSDEDERTLARRMVAQRCLYGVDRNPVALDLAKLSLWLVTLARDHPLTFVDHALRHGDALVGLSRRQIESFHWKPGSQAELAGIKTADAVDEVAKLRRAIREAGDDVPEAELRMLWGDAQAAAADARGYGDLLLHAFFAGKNAKKRETFREHYASELLDRDIRYYRATFEDDREASPPLVPFHWSLELPEVFDRGRPGFDAIIGNPPFAGKNTMASGNPSNYLEWLKWQHEDTHGNADLVAHFYRRSFDLLRQNGRFGLLATNTIRQGDTRWTGLRWICKNGGFISSARTRVKWPGLAAVIVAVVHVERGTPHEVAELDGRHVSQITAYLVERGGHDDPMTLLANKGKSFQGSAVLGMGFTFKGDIDASGDGSSLSVMRDLIEQDPRNEERIRPFVGWKELADSPQWTPERFAINFGTMSLEEAEGWPALVDILRRKVRPERERNRHKNTTAAARADRWWQYGSPAVELYEAAARVSRVCAAASQASAYFVFVTLPADLIYSSNLSVVALETSGAFACLQCRLHEEWTRVFMSTMKDDWAYTPTSCFQNFPFPDRFEMEPTLVEAGSAYETFRADLMILHDEGLTKTYNRFHDPEETDPGILRLRELHEAMDRAVLDAYGWNDVSTACEFLLDYEVEVEDDEEGGRRRRKKPWRYRWPDVVRDDVLARLLELNAERAAAEQRAGVGA